MPPLRNNWQRLMLPGIVVLVAAGLGAFWYFAGGEDGTKKEPAVAGPVRQKTAPKLESRPGPANDKIKPGPPKIKADQAKTGEENPGIPAGFKPYPSEEVRETFLDSVVNETGAGLNVELKKNAVLPTDMTSRFSERSRFRTTVSGAWADAFKYITRLQKPEEFRLVRRIALVSKPAEGVATEQVVEAQVELEKWWAKPDESGDAAGNSLTADQQKFLQRVGSVEHLPIELVNHAMAPLFAANSQVRMTSIEAEREYKGTLEKVMIVIHGESDGATTQPIAVYMTSLKRTAEFKGFNWEASPASAAAGGGHSFKLSGTLMIDENGESK